MENDEVLWSKNGECPYCNSDDVMNTGKVGAGASSSTKLPEANIKVWLCNQCKKGFFYQGE
ncbi:hypothetical protein KA005_23830 [bacterium]|nr:hypothetical protein [bacterium]